MRKHSSVRELNARGVRFSGADLAEILPLLQQLESLELEKPGYEDPEIGYISDNLPRLRRLVLAGGMVGSVGRIFHAAAAVAAAGAPPGGGPPGFAQQEWTTLSHPGLQELTLEGGRAGRLRLAAPRLASLEVKDFVCSSLQMAEGEALTRLAVTDCSKMTDSALRFLLRVDADNGLGLPTLTSLSLAGVSHVTDDTLRAVGLRHAGLQTLAVLGCPALTGDRLATNHGFRALRTLTVESCDGITG